MAVINPLERGKNLDVLLKTLMEAGITTPSLQFLLGINPDTLSAYLLRSSQDGNLYVTPGPDWYNEFSTPIQIWARATYAAALVPTPYELKLDTTRNYILRIGRGDDGFSTRPITVQTTSEREASSNWKIQIFLTSCLEILSYNITLHPGTTLFTVNSKPVAGILEIETTLFPIPP